MIWFRRGHKKNVKKSGKNCEKKCFDFKSYSRPSDMEKEEEAEAEEEEQEEEGESRLVHL